MNNSIILRYLRLTILNPFFINIPLCITMPLIMPCFLPINKAKDAATKQRLLDNLMATVGTAVTAAAVVSAGMSLTVVMVVVVTLGFGVIV